MRLQNVVTVNVSGNFQWDYYGDDVVSGNQGTHLPVLTMAATRDIKAGEELFTCYPPGVCKSMGIDYDIDLATSGGHYRVKSNSSALAWTVGQVHNRPAESEFDPMSSMELTELLASQNPTDKPPLDSTNSEAISETAESPRTEPIVFADAKNSLSTEISLTTQHRSADDERLPDAVNESSTKVIKCTNDG